MFAVGRSGTADTKIVDYAENEQICPERDSTDYVQRHPVLRIWGLVERGRARFHSVAGPHGQATVALLHTLRRAEPSVALAPGLRAEAAASAE